METAAGFTFSMYIESRESIRDKSGVSIVGRFPGFEFAECGSWKSYCSATGTEVCVVSRRPRYELSSNSTPTDLETELRHVVAACPLSTIYANPVAEVRFPLFLTGTPSGSDKFQTRDASAVTVRMLAETIGDVPDVVAFLQDAEMAENVLTSTTSRICGSRLTKVQSERRSEKLRAIANSMPYGPGMRCPFLVGDGNRVVNGLLVLLEQTGTSEFKAAAYCEEFDNLHRGMKLSRRVVYSHPFTRELTTIESDFAEVVEITSFAPGARPMWRVM